MITAIYPGTFDPLTNGHEDLAKRASKLFERVIIGITQNSQKKTFLHIDERIQITKEVFKKYDKIEVKAFDGLLKDFVQKENARVIIRGLRSTSDFEYEMKMASINSYLSPNIQTIFIKTSDQFQFISSSVVREIMLLGGDINKFVPSPVEKWLKNAFTCKK